jgi:hypothetical protein
MEDLAAFSSAWGSPAVRRQAAGWRFGGLRSLHLSFPGGFPRTKG